MGGGESTANGVRGKPLLAVYSASKTWGQATVLNRVDLLLWPGEVVGLVGDNGAGKSTLVKIVAGSVRPDPTTSPLVWGGTPHAFQSYSVSVARSLGIETVYQERALFPGLSVWRNLFAGREPARRFVLRRGHAIGKTQALLQQDAGFGLSSLALSPESRVQGLSGGEKQALALSRAVAFGARLLLLDEPFQGLSLSEVDKTLDLIRELQAKGVSLLLVDHNIFHVYSVSDRILVMDRGHLVAEVRPADLSLDDLTTALKRLAKGGTWL